MARRRLALRATLLRRLYQCLYLAVGLVAAASLPDNDAIGGRDTWKVKNGGAGEIRARS